MYVFAVVITLRILTIRSVSINSRREENALKGTVNIHQEELSISPSCGVWAGCANRPVTLRFSIASGNSNSLPYLGRRFKLPQLLTPAIFT